MNKFELFTMIYFWLDRFYNNTTDDFIISQLSDMDPFIWKDEASGDPAVFSEYCDFIGKKKITLDNSLQIAKEYVRTIDYVDVSDAFKDVDEEEWKNECREYIASEHKGGEARQI